MVAVQTVLIGNPGAAGVNVALEHLDLGAQHSPFRQHAGHIWRHGAEILADDHAAVALAFERYDRHHLLEPVMDVSAIARGFARDGAYAIVEPDFPLREFTVSLHWSRR